MNFNRKKIQHLLLNKNKSKNVPSELLDFVQDYKFTVINKFEDIDENCTKFNLKIKKSDKEIYLNLKISRDNLLTSSITFRGKESKIITRDLEQIKNFLREIFLG
jgi:septum formation topological specificity factor MinE